MDLDQNSSFEALSYTLNLDTQWKTLMFEWVEDTEKQERIILSNSKTLDITLNL
jgi:hypothetical protein